jgi:hypothetical protein
VTFVRKSVNEFGDGCAYKGGRSRCEQDYYEECGDEVGDAAGCENDDAAPAFL